MNKKDKELIKSLSALLSRLKKMFHFGSAFFHHHPAAEEDKEKADDPHTSHKDVNLTNATLTNDSTGENAIKYVLKNENLTSRDN
jgi:hypothetical protein